jgi:beta-galactosidase
MWDEVAYEPGELKVVAFDKAGKVVAEKSIKTAGKPYRLILEADRQQLMANGEDLSYITVRVVDKDNNPCPTATKQLNFKVTGQGAFRAACNGDATSLELFHLPTMKLFSGKLVVIVQSTLESGAIQLIVKGEGLKSGKITLNSK